MKRSHLIILGSVATLVAGIAGSWVYGSFHIKKILRENPIIKVEKVNITGFPFAYKINLENITISGKLKDKLVFKRVQANLGLLKRKLNIQTLDEIIISTSVNGQDVVKYQRCKVPSNADFDYKNYFWFIYDAPQIQKFSYSDKDCRTLDSNNQELFRVDETTINLNVSDAISFSLYTRGFKDYIFDDIKIGDFKFNLEGEVAKTGVVVDHKEKSPKQDLIIVAGERVQSAKLHASLESALLVNSNLTGSYVDKGYEINADVIIAPIENIINNIVKQLNIDKDIVSKMIEMASVKEGDATKFIIQFSPNKGVTIGNQPVNELVKKYFYLQQSQIATDAQKHIN